MNFSSFVDSVAYGEIVMLRKTCGRSKCCN